MGADGICAARIKLAHRSLLIRYLTAKPSIVNKLAASPTVNVHGQYQISIRCLPGATETAMPARVAITGVTPAAGSTVLLLGTGGAGQAIPWERSADGCVLLPPTGVAPPNADAWVFRMSSAAR